MKLVVDMNLSTEWVPSLSGAGIEAVHWLSIGPQDAADDVIMAWAQANAAIVLTRDLDFAALLMRQRLTSASVIQFRSDQVRPGTHLARLRRTISANRTHLEKGAIVTIEDDRVRVRILGGETNF